MGKYEDAIGEIKVTMSVEEVLDEASANKVDQRIKAQKKALEEPTKFNIDIKDAEKKIQRLNNRLDDLRSAKAASQSKLKGLTINEDNMKEVNKAVAYDKKIDGQIKSAESEMKQMRGELKAYKQELKAERGKSRKLSDEEKTVDRLIAATSQKKTTQQPTTIAKQIGKETEALKKNTQAANENAAAQERLNSSKKKTNTLSSESVNRISAAYNKAKSARDSVYTKEDVQNPDAVIDLDLVPQLKQAIKRDYNAVLEYKKLLRQGVTTTADLFSDRSGTYNTQDLLDEYQDRMTGYYKYLKEMGAELTYQDFDAKQISRVGGIDKLATSRWKKYEASNNENDTSKQVQNNEELADSYKKVESAKSEAAKQPAQSSDISDAQKQVEINKELADSYKKVEEAKKSVKKPGVLEDIEVLESTDEIDSARTMAQKRKAAADLVKGEYAFYKEMQEIFESGGEPSKNGNLFSVSYDSILLQQKRIESSIALYEKYGGKVEKLGKRISQFSNEQGFTGGYQRAVDEYEESLKEAEKQVQANEEVVTSYEKVGQAKNEAVKQSTQGTDTSDTQKQVEANKELTNSYKEVEDAKSQLVENPNGEFSLWENATKGAKKVKDSVNDVKSTIKETADIGEQINLFDDGYIQSIQKVGQAQDQVNNKFREYSDLVSVGYDRIQKLNVIRNNGIGADSPWATEDLLRANHGAWDNVKENNFFNGMDVAKKYAQIGEVLESTASQILQSANLTEDQVVAQLKNVRNAIGGNFKPDGYNKGWNFFSTYDNNGNKHPVQKDNGITYKVYAAFENIEDLNADIISSIMSELTKAGFKGRLKTMSGADSWGDKARAVASTDQLVIHGASKKDQEIAYNVLRNFKTPLSYLGGGIDTPDGSFTQTLAANKIDKYVQVNKQMTENIKEETRARQNNTNAIKEEAAAQEKLNTEKDVVSGQKDTEKVTNEVQQLESHLKSLGDEFQQSNQFSNIWDNLVNEVKSGAKTAEQAIKELDDAFKSFNTEKSLGGAEKGALVQIDSGSIKEAETDLKNVANTALQASDAARQSAKSGGAESDAMKELAGSAEEAASSKKKFTSANKGVDSSAKKSASSVEEEGEAAKDMSGKFNEAWDSISTTRRDGNTEPSSITTKTSNVKNGVKGTISQTWVNDEEEGWNLASEKITYSIQEFRTKYESELKKLKDIDTRIDVFTDSDRSQLSSSFNKKLEQYKAYITELETLSNQLRNDKSLANDANWVQNFNNLAKKAQQAGQEINNIVSETEKLNKVSRSGFLKNKFIDTTDLSEAQDEMKAFANAVTNGAFEFEKFSRSGTEMYGTFTKASGAVEKITVSFNRATGEMKAFDTGVKSISSDFSRLTSSLSKGVKQFAAMYLGLNDFIRYIKQGVDYVREIDTAMTELRKVTNETEATYRQFGETASSVAKEIGTTMSEIISSAADWSRVGYNLEEATALAKNTSILMNVSEFDNIADATDSMVSAIQAFKQEGVGVADLSMDIIDAYNEVGNNYAISTSDLADSLTRSSASLVAAGNTLSEAIALTTAANTVLQDPASVGTTLKTVSMRLRGTSAKELAAAGEETDGLIESTSQLAKKIQELTSIDGQGGVKILTDTGAYKSTYQILLEISKVWEDINDIDQAALLEVLAGKRNGNVVASILQDGNLLESIYESAEDSEGSATRELNTYLNSVQGHIDQLTNSMQTMWNNALNGDVIKFFVDLARTIIEIVDKIGLIPTALTAITGFLSLRGTNIFFNLEKDGTGAFQSLIKQAKAFNAEMNKMSNGGNISFKDRVANAAAYKKNKKSGTTSTGGADTIVTDSKNVDKATQSMQKYADAYDEVYAATTKATAGETANSAATQANTGTKKQSIGATIKQTVSKIANTGAVIANTGSWFANAAAMAVATVKTIALKVATAALQMGIVMVASVLITKLISALQASAQRMDDLKTEATETASTLEDNRKAVSDYADEIQNLRATLADSTTSERDAYDARVRLMEIQDDLVSRFGAEAQGIDLVTGSLKEQIAAMEELSRQESSDYLTNYAAAFKDAQKELNKKVKSKFTITAGDLDSNLRTQFTKFMTSKGFDVTQNEDTGQWKFSAKDTKVNFQGIYDEAATWIAERAAEGYDVERLRQIVSAEMSDLEFNDEDYLKNLDVYNAYVENKALADYTSYYKDILDKQGAYKEAAAQGDVSTEIEALDQYKAALESAAKAASDKGEDYMADYFNSQIDALETEITKADFMKDVSDTKSSAHTMAQNLKKIFTGNGLTQDDLMNMFNLDKAGTLDTSGYTNSQIEAFRALAKEADNAGLSISDATDALVQMGYIKVSPDIAGIENVGKSIDMLKGSEDAYQAALAISKETTYDNMQVSSDYYSQLSNYLGDNAKFAEAVAEDNGRYLVKNSQLLKEIIAQKRKEQAADVALSKSQAQLRYYDLYKQMRNITNGTNNLTDAERNQVNALWDQMNAIEQTINKYSLLEAQLLGTSNAFNEFEEAQSADAETNYVDSVGEMYSALSDALHSGKLGTETAKAAIKGLVPESVYQDLDTVEQKMAAIDKYVKNGSLSKYFKVEYDSDGTISNIETTFESLTKFIQDGLNKGVFVGPDTEHFELSDEIDSLHEFAEAFNITDEAAFALLQDLQNYDIEWLNGDNQGMLDKLMTDDLTYSIYQTTSALADLEHQMANGEISVDEYNSKYQELSQTQSANAQQARESATSWIEASNNYDTAYSKVKELNDEIAQMKTEGASEEEIQVKTDELAAATTELQNALEIKQQLVEPTDIVLQLALDQIKSQIEQWESENIELTAEVVPKLTQDENGIWTIPAEVEANLSEEEKQKIEEYINLLNDKNDIQIHAGEAQQDQIDQLNEVQSLLDQVQKTIEDMPEMNIDCTKALESIKELAEILEKIKNGDYDVGADVDAALKKDKKQNTARTSRTAMGENLSDSGSSTETAQQVSESVSKAFDDFWNSIESAFSKINDAGSQFIDSAYEFFNTTLPQIWNDFWDGVNTGLESINNKGVELAEKAQEFFSTTLPEKWNEFWDSASEFVFEVAPVALGELSAKVEWFFQETLPSIFESINDKGVELKQKAQEFFKTTLPQKWDELWDNIDAVFENIDAWCDNLSDRVHEFFDFTIPQKWDEFWDAAALVFQNINDAGSQLADKVREFFGITIPTKWDNFWDSVDNVFEGIDAWCDNLSDKIHEFFDETIPQKWNDFWDSVANTFEGINDWGAELAEKVQSFFKEIIPSLWEKFKSGFMSGRQNEQTKLESEKANDTLKQLGKTNYTFDVNSNDINDVIKQIKEAQKALNKFVNTDGTLNIDASGCEEAQIMLATLVTKRQELETPTILQVDTSTSEQQVQDVINLVNQFKQNYNTLELQTAVGGDTTQAQADLNSTISQLQASSPEILASLGIDPAKSAADINAAINSITPNLMIKAGVDPTEVEAFQAEDHSASGTCTWENNATKVQTWMKQTLQKTGYVTWKNKPYTSPTFTANGTITWGSGDVNGTANSSGTAHARGNWGLPRAEHNSLVGELGQELVVDPHSGRYYTVGDHGAEMVDLPKDAIVFNHIQTKALLEHGYVLGRGKAYAEGNAHVIRYKSGSGSSSSSTSSKSSSKNSSSSSSSSDDNKQTIDFIEYKINKIESTIERTSNTIENFLDDASEETIKNKNQWYSQLIDAEKEKAKTYQAAVDAYNNKAMEFYNQIPQQYQEMAKNGAIAIKDFVGESEGEIAEAIQNYRDWADKAEAAQNNYLASIAQISAYRLEQFNDIADDFENLMSLIESKSALIQAQIDLIETSGGIVSKKRYEELMDITKQNIEYYNQKRNALQNLLSQSVADGTIKVGSSDWYEMQKQINDTKLAIYECYTSLEEFQNKINDLKWDRFDYLIDRFDALKNEIDSISNTLSRKDLFKKGYYSNIWDGWTAEGLTVIGLHAQQMELAQNKAHEYSLAIQDLKKDLEAGTISQIEYTEKLQELQEAQWDCINTYNEEKEAIVDLVRERIEAIKDGIEKEVSAYEKLIEKRKEALQAAKDERDWEKDVNDQRNAINKLEKQISAMQYSTDASTIAKRKQLEAQLLEEKAKLADLYYDHSIDTQTNMLDDELEAFQEEKDKEQEALDDYLEDTEKVISDALKTVLDNHQVVYDTLTQLGQEYGITLTDAIVDPWQSGKDALSVFNDSFTSYVSAWSSMLAELKNQVNELFDSAENSNQDIIDDVNADGFSGKYYRVKPGGKAPSGLSVGDRVVTAGGTYQITGVNDDGSYNSYLAEDTTLKTFTGKYEDVYTTTYVDPNGEEHIAYLANDTAYVDDRLTERVPVGSIVTDGHGRKWKRVSETESILLSGYAKGTKSIDEDQFAIVDELGPELQLVPDGNGRLAYMKAGTGVIPADLTQKLMNLALDPTSVLENAKPKVNPPMFTNNNITIDMDIAEVVHIEHVDNNSIDNLSNAVKKQMDTYMKDINNKLRRKV